MLLVISSSFRLIDDIYGLSIKTKDGKRFELGNFKGRKMIFIMLPLSADSNNVSPAELSAFMLKQDSSLVVIGVPLDDAAFEKQEDELYMNQQANYILAESMKVKEAADKQSSLFRWLTDKDKNGHFDVDVTGTGQKFFVDEAGELYAVMGGETKLSNPIIDKILAKVVTKK